MQVLDLRSCISSPYGNPPLHSASLMKNVSFFFSENMKGEQVWNQWISWAIWLSFIVLTHMAETTLPNLSEAAQIAF